jgi:1-acyl-sn-glycerol-3-phosphate acyltransferase
LLVRKNSKMNIARACLAYLFRGILLFLGWELLDETTIRQLTELPRTVLVFSHTSYWDFYILTLYLLSYPDELQYVRVLIKPQPFRYAGWILRKLGAIPATSVKDNNGGGVARIVEELKKSPRSALLISPKGTILKREWRTGYYAIADQLDGSLIATGLDYEKKRVYVSPSIEAKGNYETTVSAVLVHYLSKIVPLVPENEMFPIRLHDTNKVGIVSTEGWMRITYAAVAIIVAAKSLV